MPAHIVLPCATRGAVSSWSAQAAARNTAFLRAQPPDGFRDGEAFAATLTLGRCPESAEEWQALRKRFVDRVRRMGLVRLHWVVEWTLRGWPHLHCSIWLAAGTRDGSARILRHWLDVTTGHRTLERSQHVEPIARFGGWARYVGKHAARGVTHYQRSRRHLPPGWQSSGRMWGHCGDWHAVEPEPTTLTPAEGYRFRRLLRKLEASKAQARGDRAGVRAARRMWRCNDEQRSRVRGASVWSDWPGQELAIVAALAIDVERRRALDERGRVDRAALADLREISATA